jgi:hypothetical protein
VIPTVVVFVLVPLVGAGAAAWDAIRGDGGGRPELSREGSERTAGAGAPLLSIERTPVSYRMTYSIELYRPDSVTVTREEIEVRRPFDARIVSFVGDKRTDVRASRLGALVLTTGGGVRTLVSPPAPAASDIRVDAVIDEAVQMGTIEPREQRRVVDRDCQVYRAGGTILSGELVAIGTNDGEHADFCVDEAGLVLEEVWVQDGHAVRRRVATKVEEDVRFDDGRFSLADEEALTAEEGNGFIRSVDPASAFEGVVYRLPDAPEGFQFVGRYVVQPPKLSPLTRDPLAEEQPTGEQVSMVDVWTRGAQMLALYQTIAADVAAVPSRPRTYREVDVPVGAALAVLDLRINEVRIELPEDRFIRLMGTLPTQTLVEIASGLRAEAGAGLRFL